ncbi:MAG: TonB-dependent receptor [Oleispira sp.]|nr:TonB-dependent receptor [Oleispira sp.]
MKNLLTLAISTVSLSIASLSLVSAAVASETVTESDFHELDSQQVSGSLYSDPVAAAAFNVTVLERADLELLPVNTVIGALEYVSGLDVRQRGLSGTQADVSIRGSSYEQTLVLLDGMRMNDPQTGHHNFDIPIAFEDIERIEIVKGPGASQYGAGSNGGVINIVSRKSVTTSTGRNAKVSAEFGSYNYQRYALSLAKTEGSFSQFFSVNQSSSDSYIRDEALDTKQDQISYRVVHQGDGTTTQAAFGYLEKDFGAYKFYDASETQARESTAQRHGYVTHQYRFDSGTDVDLSMNWRNHFDVFDYPIGDVVYRSKHETETLQSRGSINHGALSAGIEYNDERMVSSRDGSEGRSYSSIYALYKFALTQNSNLSTSISGLDYGSKNQYALPVIGFDMLLSSNAEFYANAGQAARIPTLNELYLDMSSNQGNEDLKVETTNSTELGIRLSSSDVNFDVSVFYKETKDAIDFTKTQDEIDSGAAYMARNYGDNTIKGYDLELDGSAYGASYLNMSLLKLTHTRLFQDLETDLAELKNTQSQLENQTALHAGFDLSHNWFLVSVYKYESRFNSDDYQILDMGLNYQEGGFTASLDASNLLDAKYVDAGFVPAPGPALILGLGYEL